MLFTGKAEWKKTTKDYKIRLPTISKPKSPVVEHAPLLPLPLVKSLTDPGGPAAHPLTPKQVVGLSRFRFAQVVVVLLLALLLQPGFPLLLPKAATGWWWCWWWSSGPRPKVELLFWFDDDPPPKQILRAACNCCILVDKARWACDEESFIRSNSDCSSRV